jgi:hypothetical protein
VSSENHQMCLCGPDLAALLGAMPTRDVADPPGSTLVTLSCRPFDVCMLYRRVVRDIGNELFTAEFKATHMYAQLHGLGGECLGGRGDLNR